MQPFSTITTRALVLSKDDVDTDQIIPARYLTTTERVGLGRYLFADWRGLPGDAHGWLAPGAVSCAEARLLVAGRNFGCGSSREHAAWALVDFGFKAIVARSFADIFRGNALKNGLVPLVIGDEPHDALLDSLTRDPGLPCTVDIQSLTLTTPDDSWAFELPPFSRRCLLDGVDEMGFLLAATDEVAAWERSHQPAGATGA